jgi:purine-binding chemotaxis protein CheW
MNAASAVPVQNPRPAASLAGKYLTFILQDESYGIEVLKVREIIRNISISTVPQMPEFIRGVINLRGKSIPVLDVRRWLGFAGATNTDQTCIVVQVELPDGKATRLGMVVDGIGDVISFNDDDIEKKADWGGRIATDYVAGLAKFKGMIKVLLDVNRLVETVACITL